MVFTNLRTKAYFGGRPATLAAGQSSSPPPAPVRWLSLALVVAGPLLLGAACGSSADRAPDQVTGLITQISRGAGGQIRHFAVRQGTELFEIRIDPRRNYGFDLEHLEQHRASEWPVTVRLDERDGALYAVEILDAQSPGDG